MFKEVKNTLRTMTLPDMSILADKSLEELRNLGISQVYWIDGAHLNLGLLLTDKQ